ncbi:MAG: hypothetical protein AB8G26_14240 [Ilumatobacter sp.]
METSTASAQRARYDVVVITDTRFSGGSSSSLVEEITAASHGGFRVGVVHLESSRLGPSAMVHAGLRDAIERGLADFLLPGEAVDASLAVVKHPTVFVDWAGGALPIRVDRAIVAVGQVPHDDAGTYYDCVGVDDAIAEALGVRPRWWPVSNAVRSTLSGVDVADEEWSEIIDVARWRPSAGPALRSSGSDGSRRVPVIGRHSRPDRMKWPNEVEHLTAAYPTDGSVEVRVLGGAEPAVELLGAAPESWTILPFGAEDPKTFLADLDAFVYFHHPDMVEAFGRTVLEALAVGIPAVVAPHFESTFGAACLYAEPDGAIDAIRSLLADPAATERHRAAADDVLGERFSHEAFRRRLTALVGRPAPIEIGPPDRVLPEWESIPAGQRAGLSIELVAALGETTGEVAELIAHLDLHRRKLPGFVPIVVMTCSRPPAPLLFGIEARVITNRRNHADPLVSWEDYALKRLRQIGASYDVDEIVVSDARHPDAWIALQQRRRRRSNSATR